MMRFCEHTEGFLHKTLELEIQRGLGNAGPFIDLFGEFTSENGIKAGQLMRKRVNHATGFAVIGFALVPKQERALSMEPFNVMSKCIKNRTLAIPGLTAKPDNIVVHIRAHERSKEVLQNIQSSSSKAPLTVSCLHVRRFQVFEFLHWNCN